MKQKPDRKLATFSLGSTSIEQLHWLVGRYQMSGAEERAAISASEILRDLIDREYRAAGGGGKRKR